LLTGFQLKKKESTLSYADVKEQVRVHWRRTIKGKRITGDEEAESQKALLAAGADRKKYIGGGDY
jgi:hypothetical protein